MRSSKEPKTALDKDVEELDDTDMEPEDFERIIKGHSEEAFAMRRARKHIRYTLTRIQTEFNGGPAASDPEDLKSLYESKDGFDGWRNWKITWDLSLSDPSLIISKAFSELEEWENVVRAKFPMIEPGTGKVSYPDVKVKEKIMEHHLRLED